MTLSDRDRMLAEQARQELLETPLPPAMGQTGCVAAIVGGLILVAWPPLLERLPALSFFTPFVMLGALLVIVGGPVLLLFGGQSGRNAARAAVEASLRTLEDEEADREEQLRAAAVLVTRAWISQGPSTERILDAEDARPRIGDRMDLVLAVEEHFLARFDAWPVFSAGPAPDGPALDGPPHVDRGDDD